MRKTKAVRQNKYWANRKEIRWPERFMQRLRILVFVYSGCATAAAAAAAPGGRGKMAASSLEQKLSRLEAKLKQENREARRRIDLNLEISPARARPSKRGPAVGLKGEVLPAWMTRACLGRCRGPGGVGEGRRRGGGGGKRF